MSHDDPEVVRAWSDNLAPDGYVTFQENPRAYYDQPVEADARGFASGRLAQMREEIAALAERDAERAATVREPDESDGPGQAPEAGAGATPGAGDAEGASGPGWDGGDGRDGGDGHDDARGAFESVGGGGEASSVAQRHARGPRML